MPRGTVLELNTGLPGWHRPAVAFLCLAVIAALLITPLRWPFSVAVLLFAAAVLWRTWLQDKGRTRFPRLLVYGDFSLALIDRDGSELTAGGTGHCWVSSRLIVLRLEPAAGRTVPIVIARELNDRDAFRRFKVLCRFGFAVADPQRHNGLQSHTTGA